MEMEWKSVQVLKNPTFSIALLQHCRMQNGQKRIKLNAACVILAPLTNVALSHYPQAEMKSGLLKSGKHFFLRFPT